MEAFSVYVDFDSMTSVCVPARFIADRRRLEALGRTVFIEEVDSKIEGWARAARELGFLPDDYDDRLLPIACFEKRVLYRSVSPEELEDVLTTGVVTGGRNRFNGLDPRPLVFFSPEMTRACLWQGEELERAAGFQVIRDAGGIAAFAAEGGRELFSERLRSREQELRAARRAADYTSAVLVTKPIGPSLHYSVEHGRTGMNGEDEYGVFPGQVRCDDIEEIRLVRNMEVVSCRSIDEFERRPAFK